MFPLYLVGALGVVIRADLNLSATQLGAVAAAFFGVGGLLMPMGGRVVDRMGPRLAARLALLGAAACLLTAAVFGGSYPGLLAAMAIGGFASTIAAPVGGLIIGRGVPSGQQPLAFAIERSSVPASTLVAGLSVPTLAAVVHWRVVFAVGAVFTVLMLLYPVPAMARAEKQVKQAPLRPITPLLMVTGMFFLGSAAATALSTFFVSHGVGLGMAVGTAGVALAATSAATIGMRMLLGVVGVRFPGRVTAAVLFFSGAAGFALLMTPSTTAAWLGALLAGGAGWGWTGLLGLAVVQSHPNAPGASTALVQAGGCVGGIVGPLVMGGLIEQFGYQAGWLAMAGFATLGGLLAALNGGIWRWVSHKPSRPEVDRDGSGELTSERTSVAHSGTPKGANSAEGTAGRTSDRTAGAGRLDDPRRPAVLPDPRRPRRGSDQDRTPGGR